MDQLYTYIVCNRHCVILRVDEGERVLNRERVLNGAYINGEHHWESNMTLNAVHVIVLARA